MRRDFRDTTIEVSLVDDGRPVPFRYGEEVTFSVDFGRVGMNFRGMVQSVTREATGIYRLELSDGGDHYFRSI